ncbi:MAG: KpsF/GutQ family sugar-phosphate isomerase [Planctomycetota bacterium]|nr:KpsF/GutQ family sugar-phosphate isomerase [Planctomycetota bacterium]
MTMTGEPAAHARPVTASGEIEFARRVLEHEARALQATAGGLGEDFARAVGLIVTCAERGGTVLISGLGKSGLVGAKISATLASLGIPSHAVHPSEAAHGDLGRFRPTDTVICISCSGETEEVVALAGILRQDGLPIISITCVGEPGAPSTLERLATVALRLHTSGEAGAPEFIAPTSSTTATMALGDALALAAAKRRNFTDADFARRHPGGALGELMRPVTDVMRFVAGKNLPLLARGLSVRDALVRAAQGGRRPGAMLIVDDDGRLAGIFTDGDLRRLVLRGPDELSRPVGEVMTASPRTLSSVALVRDAVRMFREFRQDETPVVDGDGRPVGLLDVQDLIALRLVADEPGGRA